MPESRWLNIEIWMEYDPDIVSESMLDDIFDDVADAAHDAELTGCDIHVSGARNQDAPEWAAMSDAEAFMPLQMEALTLMDEDDPWAAWPDE